MKTYHPVTKMNSVCIATKLYSYKIVGDDVDKNV